MPVLQKSAKPAVASESLALLRGGCLVQICIACKLSSRVFDAGIAQAAGLQNEAARSPYLLQSAARAL